MVDLAFWVGLWFKFGYYDFSLFGLGRGEMIHYELFFLYIVGYKPKEVIRRFGYSRGTAYRMHKKYQEARNYFRNHVILNNSVSPARETFQKKVDAGDPKYDVLSSETEEDLLILEQD